MAARAGREAGVPANRKKVQRTCRRMGRIRPQETKNGIARAGRGPFRPGAPDRLRETGTAHVWCGVDGRCRCFNAANCPARRWAAYALGVHAAMGVTTDPITSAAAAEKPGCPGLRLRTGNGSQYTGRDPRRAVRAPGIGRHESVRRNAPGQNGQAESFRKTLKKECVWPHESANCREAEGIIAEAIADYNKERIRSSIGHMTPAEFAELRLLVRFRSGPSAACPTR